jgi:hypothetical protein
MKLDEPRMRGGKCRQGGNGVFGWLLTVKRANIVCGWFQYLHCRRGFSLRCNSSTRARTYQASAAQARLLRDSCALSPKAWKTIFHGAISVYFASEWWYCLGVWEFSRCAGRKCTKGQGMRPFVTATGTLSSDLRPVWGCVIDHIPHPIERLRGATMHHTHAQSLHDSALSLQAHFFFVLEGEPKTNINSGTF